VEMGGVEGVLNVVSRTALCDQRCKLDKSCSSMVCRASPLVSPKQEYKKKYRVCNEARMLRKTKKTRMKKEQRPLWQRV